MTIEFKWQLKSVQIDFIKNPEFSLVKLFSMSLIKLLCIQNERLLSNCWLTFSNDEQIDE